MGTRVYYAIMKMGYNVLLFYIGLYSTSHIIQGHYYLQRNIIYSNIIEVVSHKLRRLKTEVTSWAINQKKRSI